MGTILWRMLEECLLLVLHGVRMKDLRSLYLIVGPCAELRVFALWLQIKYAWKLLSATRKPMPEHLKLLVIAAICSVVLVTNSLIQSVI